ncbi:hypothetical protein ABZZ74_22860 [Streptomyces sp. NPDC006476]
MCCELLGARCRIAGLDTGSSLFFDHHDPEIVTWVAGRRLDA